MSLAVVTGANSGVGKAATHALAERGWSVAMVCRSEERGDAALAAIRSDLPGADLSLHLADLRELTQVARVAGELADTHPRIDLLVNNAGLFLTDHRPTPDGFETTMAVNHLAHVRLTLALRDSLVMASGRVVCVSSEAHRQGDLRRAPMDAMLRGEGGRTGVRAYADSKLANVLFAFELDRRWRDDGVRACAMHPGTLGTAIWDRNEGLVHSLLRLAKPLMGDPGGGGEAVAVLGADRGAAEIGGRYFRKTKAVDASRDARDRDLARDLWDASRAAVGEE